MRSAVVLGPEPLAHGFSDSHLLKERADKHLIVHGPVVLTVDDKVERSFARASAATRWARARLELRDLPEQAAVHLIGGVVVDDPGADRPLF